MSTRVQLASFAKTAGMNVVVAALIATPATGLLLSAPGLAEHGFAGYGGIGGILGGFASGVAIFGPGFALVALCHSLSLLFFPESLMGNPRRWISSAVALAWTVLAFLFGIWLYDPTTQMDWFAAFVAGGLVYAIACRHDAGANIFSIGQPPEDGNEEAMDNRPAGEG